MTVGVTTVLGEATGENVRRRELVQSYKLTQQGVNNSPLLFCGCCSSAQNIVINFKYYSYIL